MNASTFEVNDLLSAIQQVVGTDPVQLHTPTFIGNEEKYLKECIDTSFVSSVGRFVDQFEEKLTDFTGAKYAVAVVNGTAALHIALKLAGVEPNHEVLMPALTFVATANAAAYCGAIPHFVDCELSTLGIDIDALRSYLINTVDQVGGQCINKTTRRVIKAIVPMHTFGHPSNISGLLELANEFNLVLVEDAAESLGSWYRSKHTGTFGQVAALSFNGNKTITTGGGGALLTNDPELAQRAKFITTTAKLPHRWEYVHSEIGYNYRMPNINAAIGCAQLEVLPRLLKAKRELFSRYRSVFEKISEVEIFEEPNDCQSNYWLQTLILSESHADFQQSVLEVTNSNGVMTRPAWRLLNELGPYKDCPSMELTFAKNISTRLINIPSSAHLVKING